MGHDNKALGLPLSLYEAHALHSAWVSNVSLPTLSGTPISSWKHRALIKNKQAHNTRTLHRHFRTHAEFRTIHQKLLANALCFERHWMINLPVKNVGPGKYKSLKKRHIIAPHLILRSAVRFLSWFRHPPAMKLPCGDPLHKTGIDSNLRSAQSVFF